MKITRWPTCTLYWHTRTETTQRTFPLMRQHADARIETVASAQHQFFDVVGMWCARRLCACACVWRADIPWVDSCILKLFWWWDELNRMCPSPPQVHRTFSPGFTVIASSHCCATVALNVSPYERWTNVIINSTFIRAMGEVVEPKSIAIWLIYFHHHQPHLNDMSCLDSPGRTRDETKIKKYINKWFHHEITEIYMWKNRRVDYDKWWSTHHQAHGRSIMQNDGPTTITGYYNGNWKSQFTPKMLYIFIIIMIQRRISHKLLLWISKSMHRLASWMAATAVMCLCVCMYTTKWVTTK